MYIEHLLSRDRVSLDLAASDKKRLFEHIGALLYEGGESFDPQEAAAALLERERLGSTGIGAGVALPHGRVRGLGRARGAFCLLRRALDYEAIDQKPVTMVFALLVPEESSEEHLRILAELAGLFSNKAWRERLLAARTREELYEHLTHPLSEEGPHGAQSQRARSV